MANGVVKFVQNGKTVWTAEGSKAHREYLKSRDAAAKKPVEAPAKPASKA